MSSFFIALIERLNKTNTIFLAGALFAIFVFIPLLFNAHMSASGDLAEFLNNPLRILNGDRPYKDFWLMFPPGEVFLPAFIYELFGLNVNYLMVAGVVTSALIGVISFFLGKTLLKRNIYAGLAALLVFFNGVAAYKGGGYAYMHVYFLLLLVSALFLLRYLKSNSSKYLFVSGIFVGFAFLFRFYEAGVACLAFLAAIVIHSGIDHNVNYSRGIKSTAIFSGGVLIVLSLASLALMEIWSLMVREVVIESVSHATVNSPGLSRLTDHIGRYFTQSKLYLKPLVQDLKGNTEQKGIFHVISTFSYLSLSINSLCYYLLPFLLTGISIRFLWRKQLAKADKAALLFFLLWGLLTFPNAMVKPDINHLSQSVTPLFFLLIFLSEKSDGLWRQKKSSLNRLVSLGLIIMVILLLLPIPLLFTKAVFAQIYPGYEVSTGHGSLLFHDKSEAHETTTIIDFIDKNTKDRDYIFVIPWFSPPLYALTNRKNPTYYDSLIDLANRPSDEKQVKACNDLIGKKAKVVVHYSDTALGDGRKTHFVKRLPLLQTCIENNFKLALTSDRYWVYVSK